MTREVGSVASCVHRRLDGLLFLIAPVFVGATQVQEREIALQATCDSCELRDSAVVRIQTNASDALVLESMSDVAVDSRGRYWVASEYGGLVQVYASDGAAVGTVGRSGRGPLDFVSPSVVIPLGDSVWIFDALQGRLTLSGADLNPVRSLRTTFQVLDGVGLDWPMLAVNAWFQGGAAALRPFHIIDVRDGTVVTSFGTSRSGALGARGIPRLLGHLAKSPDGNEIWTAYRSTLRLERWSLGGDLIGRAAAAPAWFPAGGLGSLGSPTSPPEPQVSQFIVHEDGTCFLIVGTPARDWRTAWRDDNSGRIQTHGAGSVDPEKLRATRVVAVDFETWTVVATWERNLSSTAAAVGSLLAVFDDSDPFNPFIAVSRLSVGGLPSVRP